MEPKRVINKRMSQMAKSMAILRCNRGEYEDALEFLDVATKLDFTDTTILINKANCLYELKNYAECKMYCSHAANSLREASQINNQLAKPIARLYYISAKALIEMREYQAAIENLNLSISKFKLTEAIEELRKVNILMKSILLAERNKGDQYFLLGDYKRAVDHYSNAINLNSNDVGAYNKRAASYQELARLDSEKSIQIDSRNIEANVRRVMLRTGKCFVDTLDTFFAQQD